MQLAVHSDLHTELSLCTLENLSRADVVVLAGDIGDVDSLPFFFARLREAAPEIPVLYVLGNHDRYGFTYSGSVDAHRRIAESFAVTLLENESIIIDDVLFCGTTLWSDFALGGNAQESMAWVDRVLPDGQYISCDDGEPFTARAMCEQFALACDFIRTTCQSAKTARKKVVISHFLPARELVAKQHAKNLLRSAYWASDIPEVYSLADVWIYGHSHTNINLTLKNTRFVSNQRGYSRRFNGQENNGYQRDYLLGI